MGEGEKEEEGKERGRGVEGKGREGKQYRINHVADVANATGLRPQGAYGSTCREFFFSPSVVK